MNNSNH